MNKIIKLITIVLALMMLSLPVLGETNVSISNGSSMDAGKIDPSSMDAGKIDPGSMDSNNNDSGSMNEKAREMYDNGSTSTPTTVVTAVETTSATIPKTPGFEIALGALSTVAAVYMLRRRV